MQIAMLMHLPKEGGGSRRVELLFGIVADPFLISKLFSFFFFLL